MPSHYLNHVKREVQRQLAESRPVHTQMCLDAAVIAANEVFNMGPSRCLAFAQAFSEALTEIAEITTDKSNDMDYAKDKLDSRLKVICGEHFNPWDERYAR